MLARTRGGDVAETRRGRGKNEVRFGAWHPGLFQGTTEHTERQRLDETVARRLGLGHLARCKDPRDWDWGILPVARTRATGTTGILPVARKGVFPFNFNGRDARCHSGVLQPCGGVSL